MKVLMVPPVEGELAKNLNFFKTCKNDIQESALQMRSQWIVMDLFESRFDHRYF